MKPAIYIETSIISYLVGWLNRRDLVVASNQELTRVWWTTRRKDFDPKVYSVCREAGFEPPLICTPYEFAENR